jgi:uncharacterized protein YegJ (DUF2314 family)
MVKPIPVFAFVFAAFSATSAGGPIDVVAPAEDEPAEGREARDLFLTTWRMLSRHSASLRVRVGVEFDAGSAEPRLALRGQDAEEIWLGEISETGRGFTGIATTASKGASHIRPGQAIGFELRHILGWSLDIERSVEAQADVERESRTNLELI